MDQVNSTGETITLIHFTYSLSQGGIGSETWRIACMPNMTEFHMTIFHPSYHRSNDVRAVNCPACKKTTTFKQAQETLESALKRPARAT